MEKFLTFPKKFENEELTERWSQLIKIRDVCNISIEEKRASKEIGSSLEADLNIQLNEKYKEIVEDMDLSELCIVSKAVVNFDNQSDILVVTKKLLEINAQFAGRSEKTHVKDTLNVKFLK